MDTFWYIVIYAQAEVAVHINLPLGFQVSPNACMVTITESDAGQCSEDITAETGYIGQGQST